MSAKTISIINSPAPTHGDASVTNGVMSITGLSPFKTGTLQGLTIQRNLVSTPQKWTSSFTAGAAVICAFNIQQNVNGLVKASTFTSSGTTTAAVMAELNAFFGGAGAYGDSTFTDATSFDVQYKYASNVLYIKGTTTNPICQVTAAATNTSTIASDMSLTLESQACVNGAAIVFKVTAHGLATGNMVSVGTLTDQTAANNNIWRVVYVTANTFNLVDPTTLVAAVASGTTSAAGTVTVIAQEEFGTPSYVDADAALNGSTETTDQTTYNYSAVDIYPLYTSDVVPNPSMRQAACRVWIPDAGATTAVSTNGQALLAFLDDYVTG